MLGRGTCKLWQESETSEMKAYTGDSGCSCIGVAGKETGVLAQAKVKFQRR